MKDKNYERIHTASEHTERMGSWYEKEIKRSVEGTVIYKGLPENPTLSSNKRSTTIILTDEDSVSAIINHASEKTAVLNFASYKRPGGGFMSGMMAQEEALCHRSFLYNVLREFPEYYAFNNGLLNSGFYTNRALYSPDIVFNDMEYCDVITCAAPNATRMIRYKTGQEALNQKALLERIFFVLNIAADQKVDTLILGAYGCGVFKQDPEVVAWAFKYYLETVRKGTFKKVVFAIPNKDSYNYKAFKEVFKGWANII